MSAHPSDAEIERWMDAIEGHAANRAMVGDREAAREWLRIGDALHSLRSAPEPSATLGGELEALETELVSRLPNLATLIRNVFARHRAATLGAAQPERFRKKPVVVEAMQYGPDTCAAICEWLGYTHPECLRDDPCGKGEFYIETLEGVMVAQPGDWIIKGIKGEFYPCKPDIFAATYEPEP